MLPGVFIGKAAFGGSGVFTLRVPSAHRLCDVERKGGVMTSIIILIMTDHEVTCGSLILCFGNTCHISPHVHGSLFEL